MPLHLPVQAVVDRSAPLSYATIDQEVRNDKGQLIQILRNPVDGPYGREPADPGWYPRHVDPRMAVCQILSSYAVARCLRGGGYF
jgi:hypothetical protein